MSTSSNAQTRDLSKFADTYDRGRSTFVCAFWFAYSNLVFRKWWFPATLRPVSLRFFGANIGANVLIRHDANIMWPWKVSIGDNCWIGENTWFITLNEIKLDSDVCISQGATLCSGSHEVRTLDMKYKNGPIHIKRGSWVALNATVLAGSVLGENAVVAANETHSGELAPNHIKVGGTVKFYEIKN